MVFTDLSYGYFLYEWAGLARGPVLTNGKHPYFMHDSTIIEPGVLYFCDKTCFTRHLSVHRRAASKSEYINHVVIYLPTDSMVPNVRDVLEASTRTTGYDAREVACITLRVSRATRVNASFLLVRSLRLKKDMFSVNYTTWRV